MSAIEKFDQLIHAMAPRLKEIGWRRKGAVWSMPGKHGFALFNLQKERWPNEAALEFWLNTGAYFPALVALDRGAHHSLLSPFTPSMGYPGQTAWNGRGMAAPPGRLERMVGTRQH